MYDLFKPNKMNEEMLSDIRTLLIEIKILQNSPELSLDQRIRLAEISNKYKKYGKKYRQ